MSPTTSLYLAIALYGAGTVATLASLALGAVRLQRIAFWVMAAGLLAHTFWIGTICTITGHPPLTNLPEAVSFIAWTLLLINLILQVRYRIDGASFFVYPLVLLLLSTAAIVRDAFQPLPPELRSNVFIGHLLFTTVGVAGLLVALAFSAMYLMQERAIKSKKRGRIWKWVPSLRVCDRVSYRALTIGFSIYTVGVLAGIAWAYRASGVLSTPGVKEVGALVAWVMFAALLQSYLSGTYRTPRTLVIGAIAFLSILAAIFGIQHA